MTKGIRISVAVMAAVVLGSGAYLASAQDGPGERGHGRGRGGERIARFLDLSDEQQATWKSMHEKHQADMQPLREEGKALHEKLKAAMDAPTPDATQVGQATLALKAHREKVHAAQEAFKAQLAATLNPEQKTKFDALQEMHRGGPEGRRGGFRGGHGHPDAPLEN
jgi:Spy/CpxP family protein refolding chaperone